MFNAGEHPAIGCLARMAISLLHDERHQFGSYLRGVSLFGRRWRRHYALVARAGPPSGESIWFALRFLVPILDHLSADLALPLIGRVPRSVQLFATALALQASIRPDHLVDHYRHKGL